MTDVLARRPTTAAGPAIERSAPAAPVWLRGVFAATWAVAVGVASLIVLALIVWAADSQAGASAGEAMRFAIQMWLLAQRTPLRVPGGVLTIPPLGLTVLLGLLLARATAIVARGTTCGDIGSCAVIVAAVAVPYAVMATLLAAVSQTSALRPEIAGAFGCTLLVGVIAASVGVIWGASLAAPIWASIRPEIQIALQAAGTAALVLVGAATVLVLGALIAHSQQVGSVVSGYRGGSGAFSVSLLSLLLVPNAICFGLAYLIGPGFAIGSGTSVAYGGVHLGALPAMPVLAAVPTGAAPWQIIVLSMVVLAVACAAGGWRIARVRTLSLEDQLRCVVIAAASLGLGVAALIGFAGGSGGPGRLRAVGPSPWHVGLTVAGEMTVVSVLVVLAVMVMAQVGPKLRR